MQLKTVKRRRAGMIAGMLWLATSLAPATAAAQDLIHADLPLWGYGDREQMWPRSTNDSEGFGCAHNMKLGDWKLTTPEPGEEPDVQWFRFELYGAIHCFLNVQEADDASGLDAARIRHAFIVDLGPAKAAKGSVNIWALQLGTRPGSDYLLLASDPERGTAEGFSVLQARCPKANLREGEPIDILDTSYCSIRSQAELRALAQRMAKLAPIGELAFVAAEPGLDETAPVAPTSRD